jgi:hypothetical protein
LCIGGKNAQQNEILIKKYLGGDDLYFHGDVVGASSIILKSGGKEVPPATIEECGAMALCISRCWDDGVIQPVWHVSSDQVSKSAPSGEYLKTGSFVVRGKKNYVEAHRLEYGVGILFRVRKNVDENDGPATKEIGDLSIEDLAVPVLKHMPTGEEEIVHCIPVCGPWRVISKYKFKAKLLPGNTKKGKLVQDVIHRFLKASDEREKKFIKDINVEEFMNVLIPRCKLGK